MNRNTVANIQAAGFQLREVNNLFRDVVKSSKRSNPGTVKANMRLLEQNCSKAFLEFIAMCSYMNSRALQHFNPTTREGEML